MWYDVAMKCQNGRHDVTLIGRASNGQCRGCWREAQARYDAKRKDDPAYRAMHTRAQAKYRDTPKGIIATARSRSHDVIRYHAVRLAGLEAELAALDAILHTGKLDAQPGTPPGEGETPA